MTYDSLLGAKHMWSDFMWYVFKNLTRFIFNFFVIKNVCYLPDMAYYPSYAVITSYQ